MASGASEKRREGLQIKRVACGHCPCQCGLLAYVQEGQLVKVTGNRNHLLIRGAICKKGKAASEYFYHQGWLNNVCTDDEPDHCDPFCGTW